MMGTMVAALGEGLALAEAADLSKQDVLDVLVRMRGPPCVLCASGLPDC